MEVQYTSPIILENLHNKISTGKIGIPLHQRPDKWTKKRKRRWAKNLEKAAKTTGQIGGQVVLYKVKADLAAINSIWKINDGSQRSYHSINYLLMADKDSSTIIDILKKVTIMAQHVIYEDENEAYEEFRNINSEGTIMSPRDYMRGVFTTEFGDKYIPIWEPKLKRISTVVGEALCIAGPKKRDNDDSLNLPSGNTISTIDKRIRDDLGLFLRFVNEDKSQKNYNTAASRIDPDDFMTSDLVEQNLLKYIKANLSTLDEKIDEFYRFLKNAR